MRGGWIALGVCLVAGCGKDEETGATEEAGAAPGAPHDVYKRGIVRAMSPPGTKLRLVEMDGDVVLIDETSHHVAMFGDRAIVRTRDGGSIHAVAARGGGAVLRSLGVDNLHLVAFPRERAIADVERGVSPVTRFAEELSRDPDVDHAEPDHVRYTQVVPDDPYMSSLWGMSNIGAPTAWNTQTGSAAVRVGVIDTGVDWSHPDLAANVWTNPGETPGNGADDDGNGYVDDVHGYDFGEGDGDPMDAEGHGTHTAGTIGAVGDNGVGVTGVCWTVRIVCLKIATSWGGLSTSAAISAIYYASSVGCFLTSNSWGGYGYSSALSSAITAANSAGVLFVAAAGNESNDNDSNPAYPASYPQSNIIAVAATTSSGARAGFSNWGATRVDLGAPGVSIRSTVPGGYEYMSGTSMATPMVSGACALVKAQFPSYSHTAIRSLILSSVTPVGSLSGQVATGGRLNLAAAIGTAPPPATGPSISVTTLSGTSASIDVSGQEYFTARAPLAGNTSASPVGIGEPAYTGFYMAHTNRWTFTSGGSTLDTGGRAVWASTGNGFTVALTGSGTVHVFVSIYHTPSGSATYTLTAGGATATVTKSTTGVTLYRFDVAFTGATTFGLSCGATLASSTVTLGGLRVP